MFVVWLLRQRLLQTKYSAACGSWSVPAAGGRAGGRRRGEGGGGRAGRLAPRHGDGAGRGLRTRRGAGTPLPPGAAAAPPAQRFLGVFDALCAVTMGREHGDAVRIGFAGEVRDSWRAAANYL